MSIGIYNPYLDTMSGGEKYMLSLAACLSNRHTVDIFWDPSQKEAISTLAHQRFGLDLSSYAFVENIFSPTVSLFDRLRKSREYDMIFYLSDGSIPFLLCPTILHFQSPLEWVSGKTLKNRLKFFFINEVIVNSKFTKSYIDKKFGVKSKVLYPPVSIQQDTKGQKENVILHVGRYGIKGSGSSYKKQEVLKEVFAEMVGEGLKDWKLVFVMSVKDEDMEKAEEFRKACKDLPIEVLINPSNTVLWQQYQKTKLYWHASGFGEDIEQFPDRAEHFGISTVEAMGKGGVPVTFKAGGQPEIVHDGKDGFLWTTTTELKEKSYLLISDKRKWEAMSEEAVQKAQRFSMETFCKKVQEFV